MSAADFFEWLTVLVMIPIAAIAFLFLLGSTLYVYFDTQVRSKNRAFSAALAIAVALACWPISFLAYLACTAIFDRRSPGYSTS